MVRITDSGRDIVDSGARVLVGADLPMRRMTVQEVVGLLSVLGGLMWREATHNQVRFCCLAEWREAELRAGELSRAWVELGKEERSRHITLILLAGRFGFGWRSVVEEAVLQHVADREREMWG